MRLTDCNTHMISAKTRMATMGGIGSGRSLHVGAASKCEHWRSIDLADLKRMGLLKPIVGGRIRAITWKNDHGGRDRLGIIPGSAGIRFVKHDNQGKLVEPTTRYCRDIEHLNGPCFRNATGIFAMMAALTVLVQAATPVGRAAEMTKRPKREVKLCLVWKDHRNQQKSLPGQRKRSLPPIRRDGGLSGLPWANVILPDLVEQRLIADV